MLALRSHFLPCFVGLALAAGCVFSSEPLPGRPAWTTSRLVGSPDPPPPMRTERVFPRLSFRSPVTLLDLPSRDRRLVLQKNGRVFTFPMVDDPAEAELAFDLGEHVQRLHGLRLAAARDCTLDPDFETNGYVYIVWSMGKHLIDDATRITRFTLTQDQPPKLDEASRLDILMFPSGDHIGASLRFGPDRCLYITSGDGSLPFPPDRHSTAQDLSDVRGSVLRIDVRNATTESPYRIPDDNPFVGRPNTREEIYAFGIRNGFRSAFHPKTDKLWVADVGWERCEMIHQIERGGNHGWSLFEGPYPVRPDQKPGPGKPILPAIVLERKDSQSVTGGIFIPPDATLALADPTLTHTYLFGCYMNGMVWTADVSDASAPVLKVAAETGLRIIDFKSTRLEASAMGQQDLLIVDFGGGGIHRLVANERPAAAEDFPRKLSETGLFRDLSTLEPQEGVLTYQPRATMYRGGAVGHHVIALPGNGRIERDFPVGTVLANTLSREVSEGDRVARRKIETQVLLFDGLNWDPYTYRWADDESDAVLVSSEGDRRELRVPDDVLGSRTIQHVFASRAQCNTCHHVFNQGPLTFNVDNVPNWNEFADAGYVKANQSGLRMIDPYDENEPLELRARCYLAINCSSCHRPAGGATSALHFNRWVKPSDFAAIGEKPTQGDFGIRDARLISPGHPDRSVLLYRVLTSGPGKMPKLAGQEPDIAGASLIWDWIESLDQASGDTEEATPADVRHTDQAMAAWRALLDTEPAVARERASQWVASTSDAAVSGVFYRWLANEDRQELVGETPDVEGLLALQGDAERGASWYRDASSSQCRNCHHVEGEQPLIGPSLAGIGKRRSRAALLEHMLDPSKEILPQWRTYTVLLADGAVVSGLKMKETQDEWVLKSSDGKEHRIAADDIESLRENPQSMMPASLLATMTPQQVADLLAFLANL